MKITTKTWTAIAAIATVAVLMWSIYSGQPGSSSKVNVETTVSTGSESNVNIGGYQTLERND